MALDNQTYCFGKCAMLSYHLRLELRGGAETQGGITLPPWEPKGIIAPFAPLRNTPLYIYLLYKYICAPLYLSIHLYLYLFHIVLFLFKTIII